MTTPQYDAIISRQQSEIEALKAENERLKRELEETFTYLDYFTNTKVDNKETSKNYKNFLKKHGI